MRSCGPDWEAALPFQVMGLVLAVAGPPVTRNGGLLMWAVLVLMQEATLVTRALDRSETRDRLRYFLLNQIYVLAWVAILLAGASTARAGEEQKLPGPYPLAFRPHPAPQRFRLKDRRVVTHTFADGKEQTTTYENDRLFEESLTPAAGGRIKVRLKVLSTRFTVNGAPVQIQPKETQVEWVMEPSGKEWSGTDQKSRLRDKLTFVLPSGMIAEKQRWRATARPDEDLPAPVANQYVLEGFFEDPRGDYARIATRSLVEKFKAPDGTTLDAAAEGRIHFSLDGRIRRLRNQLRYTTEFPGPTREGYTKVKFDVTTSREPESNTTPDGER